MPAKLRVGSLFAGIQVGGIDLGLRMAGGFETRWFCEVDPFCVKVLNKHWPGVPVYGDVCELRGSDVEPVDVLVGGFPCQPVSVAGQRKGADDDRWLWGEFARLIREIRPRWVLAENVTGLRSIDDGRLFGTVLSDLAARGYDAEWDCIPASAVGAHHIRDRVWIVAYPTSDLRGASGDDASVASDRGDSLLADATSARRGEGLRASGGSIWDEAWRAQSERRGDAGRAPHVADPSIFAQREPAAEANSVSTRWQAREVTSSGSWWRVEPSVGRVANGVPNGVDRRRALGNAVVPQVVELIGRRIKEIA